MRRHIALLLPLAILEFQPAYAWTATEIRAMPPYCAGRYALHTNPQEYKRWESQYGSDFLHTHHLCDGIGLLNNLHKARNSAQRNGMLKDATGHFNYMIQHAQSSFKLMPDVYLYRSRLFQLTDRKTDAVADLRKVIELDPKSSRAYVPAADLLGQLGQREEALKLVSEGLRHLPDHKSLQHEYTKLGGKQPYPEPYEKADAGAEKSLVAVAQEKNVETESKLAVFDLSRLLGGGGNVFREAGAHFFVEVREHKSDPRGKVSFKIVSRIPQAATRIARIGIDMGNYNGLFTTIQVEEGYFSKYYPLNRSTGFTHAFWQGFNPDYLAIFNNTGKDGKLYDPHALPSGSSLTLVATLSAGKSIDDVIDAMKEGLQSNNGLRIGIIAWHTKGYRPNPSQTIMDDGGFATGSLRKLTGFAEEKKASDPTTGSGSSEPATPSAKLEKDKNDSSAPATTAAEPKSESKPEPKIGTPTNPYCRFCP